MNSYIRGKIAEIYARFFVTIRGYRIVKKNYVTGHGSGAGEIDFVAVKRKNIYFFEVKQRSDLTKAAYAILPHQQKRIVRGAESFLKAYPQYRNYEIHFAAVLISFPFSVQLMRDAWRL